MPEEEPVTTKLTEQFPCAAMVPPERETEFELLEIAPPHWGVTGVPDTVSPDGRTSLKATWLRLTLLGLLSVKVKVEVPPSGMMAGEKDLMMVGGWGVKQAYPLILIFFI